MAVLQADRLRVERISPGGQRTVLRAVDLCLAEGRITVMLGESGAGKTVLARALAGLLPDGFRRSGGRILYRGRTLDSPAAWRAVRGRGIFYAPQNAAACLNPVVTLGRQIRECSRIGAAEIEALLVRLRFPDPRRLLGSYPHELSGGENQRGLLALALAASPDVLILDEPTSELDAEAQDEFIGLLREQQRRCARTVLLISHHLGFVREIAAHLCVLSRGEVVAAGDPAAVLAAPAHPCVREIAACLAGE
jgi:ABC-type glutathione transport system ATPase component